MRAELRGRVVKVADGDTITILSPVGSRVPRDRESTPVGSVPRADHPTQYKIRLHGIDAPEKSQAFGKAAGKHLASLIAGRDVVVKVCDTDRYGRTVGKVFAAGRDINLEMLRAGFAWHYKHYDKSPAYAAAELEARTAKRGLWSDPNPINPYDFRHGGNKTVGRDDPIAPPATSAPAASSRVEYRAGNKMPVGARTPAPVNDIWPDTGFWLSTNSNKRHNRKCENYRKTRGYPCSKSDGTPCGKCGG